MGFASSEVSPMQPVTDFGPFMNLHIASVNHDAYMLGFSMLSGFQAVQTRNVLFISKTSHNCWSSSEDVDCFQSEARDATLPEDSASFAY
jgi:hypothetical protein